MIDGGPAFPVMDMQPQGNGEVATVIFRGMSLRDWFAGQALLRREPGIDHDERSLAAACYTIADAMIAERMTREAEEADFLLPEVIAREMRWIADNWTGGSKPITPRDQLRALANQVDKYSAGRGPLADPEGLA